MSRELLTTGQVARIVGRDRSTVWRWMRRGWLPSRPVGSRLVIARSALDAWLRSPRAKNVA